MDRKLFNTIPAPPPTDTTNEAGAPAYTVDGETLLAKLAFTGTLTPGFYLDGRAQLDNLVKVAGAVSPEYLAKAAVMAHEQGFIKDAPVVLLALLTKRDPALARRVARRIITNAKQLKNFTRVVRSGAGGRKSLGRVGRGIIAEYLRAKSPDQLLRDSVGKDPSLADVIRLAHYKPTEAQASIVRWLVGAKDAVRPDQLQQLDRFIAGEGDPPNLPFFFFGGAGYDKLLERMSWQQVRQELSTFKRANLLQAHDPNHEFTKRVVARLRDLESAQRGKAMPYQVLTTLEHLRSEGGYPQSVLTALQDSLDFTVRSVPVFGGKVRIALDVSSSMVGAYVGKSNVTASLAGGVFVAAMLKKNPATELIVFAERALRVEGNVPDSIWTIAKSLPFTGGGTACGAALTEVGVTKPDLIIMISDNQSWADWNRSDPSSLAEGWRKYRNINPKARMVCWDVTPSPSVQLPQLDSVLHVGGMSDAVFSLIRAWLDHGSDFRKMVHAVELGDCNVGSEVTCPPADEPGEHCA